MPQANEPTIRIPFRYVSGIPRQSAIEIFRDFEEVLRNVNTGTASVYDAIVDPALAVSVPTNHLYVNFTELVAGEAASASHTIGFNIGVVPRATFQINEPGAISFTGWSHVNISSIAPAATEGLAVSNAPYWNMPIVNMASGQIISMSGMHVPSGTGGFFGFAGSNIVLMNECWIGSGVTCSPGSLYATDSFLGTQKLTGGSTSDDVLLHDCTWAGNTTFGGIHSFHMLGGYLNGQLHTTGNIVGGFMFEAAVQGDILINHVEGGVVNNLGSQNGTVFEIGAAVTGAMIVTGAWQNLILRGRGLRVDVRLAPTFNPAIQMLGVSDSLITATFVTGGGGTQAYTIDAASARNLIIASGLHNAAFVVASTNAGSTCLVIDELGSSTGLWGADPRKDMVPGELFSPQTGVTTIPAAIGGAPSGPAGGALSGTYPNPNFAGRDSSVDALNKDMLPGSNLGLAEGPMGVQVYGHASESALSQTTDLSGVWPYFQVTGLSGKKVSATAPGDGDILNYVTGFNVGWINSTRESSSLATKDFAKDFMLMGG